MGWLEITREKPQMLQALLPVRKSGGTMLKPALREWKEFLLGWSRRLVPALFFPALVCDTTMSDVDGPHVKKMPTVLMTLCLVSFCGSCGARLDLKVQVSKNFLFEKSSTSWRTPPWKAATTSILLDVLSYKYIFIPGIIIVVFQICNSQPITTVNAQNDSLRGSGIDCVYSNQMSTATIRYRWWFKYLGSRYKALQCL